MSTQDYDDELSSEQSYVDELYTRLDAERARVRARYRAALGADVDRMDGGTLVARDSEVRALAKQTARLDVADDGPGVPPHQRARVFERFVRLDDSRARAEGGAGLGMAIVAEVVAAHGGTVDVVGSPVGGALFRVRLPIPDQEVVAVVAEPAPARRPSPVPRPSTV